MISLLLPTRKRPDRLLQTFQSVLDTARGEIELLCYVTHDDNSYDGIQEKLSKVIPVFSNLGLPYVQPQFIRGPRLIMSDLWNALIPHAHGDIFMLCADDVVFRTPGWDVEVEAAFAACPDKILCVFCDDGGPSGKTFATLPFVSRRWIEVVGYFTGPGFSADFSDAWPQDVAEMIGRRKCLPHVLIEHCHYIWGKAVMDETYRENEARKAKDRPGDLYTKRHPERVEDARKLKEAIASWKNTNVAL